MSVIARPVTKLVGAPLSVIVNIALARPLKKLKSCLLRQNSQTDQISLCRGSQIFPTFVKFLKAEGDNEKELRSKLSSELDRLAQHLQSSGPYIKGAEVSAADLALGPKIYHVFTASKEFKVFINTKRELCQSLCAAITRPWKSQACQLVHCLTFIIKP